MFGLLASQPRYNELVRPFINLAPVVSTRHVGDRIAPLFCLKSLIVGSTIGALGMMGNGQMVPKWSHELIPSFFCGHQFEPLLNEISRFSNKFSLIPHDMNGER